MKAYYKGEFIGEFGSKEEVLNMITFEKKGNLLQVNCGVFEGIDLIDITKLFNDPFIDESKVVLGREYIRAEDKLLNLKKLIENNIEVI